MDTVCANVLLCTRSLQDSWRASRRTKPIFFEVVSQNHANRSGGTPRCLCCSHCADLEVCWKSSSAYNTSRQVGSNFLRACHTQTNGNPLSLAAALIDSVHVDFRVRDHPLPCTLAALCNFRKELLGFFIGGEIIVITDKYRNRVDFFRVGNLGSGGITLGRADDRRVYIKGIRKNRN